MADGETDEGDTERKETDKPVEDNKEDISELAKLKAHNDEIEKELIRGREFQAEAKKLEAEKMVGGKSDAGQEPVKPEQISDSDYADKFMKGEANPLGEDGISLD